MALRIAISLDLSWIIIISVLSYFTLFDNITEEIEAFVFSNFVPHTGDIVLSYLIDFQKQAKQLPWISFIFLFFTAIMLLVNMEMLFIITHSIMAICVGGVVFAIAGENTQKILYALPSSFVQRGRAVAANCTVF